MVNDNYIMIAEEKVAKYDSAENCRGTLIMWIGDKLKEIEQLKFKLKDCQDFVNTITGDKELERGDWDG